MAKINLLPWREELREKRKRDYLSVLVLVFMGSILIVYLILNAIEIITNEQRNRNALLQAEVSVLDNQISEIKKIKQQRKNVEQRTRIILNLQKARSLPTKILDELARVVPAGMYLSSINKKGSMLWIEGQSESNNNVANMMRKVEASFWLHDPNMESIVAQSNETSQLQRFYLNIAVSNKTSANSVLASKQGAKL